MFATTHMTPDAGAHGFFDESAHEVLDTGNPKLWAYGTDTGPSYALFSEYDESNWTALSTGVNSLIADACMDDSGNTYIVGTFTSPATRVAKWNGTSFSALGSGIGSRPYCCALYNGDLIVGGSFTSPFNRIARWDGSSWNAMGAGMDNGAVGSLVVIGSNLYAGGSFTTIGGSTYNFIARWNGSSWNTMGSTGLGASVPLSARAMIEWNSGLLVARYHAGGTSTINITHWNGSSFAHPLSGTTNLLNGFATNPDDSTEFILFGPTTADGVTINRIGRYNGSTIVNIGTGLLATLNPLAALYHNGDLYVGSGNAAVTGSNYRVAKRIDASTWEAVEAAGVPTSAAEPERAVSGFLSIG